MNIEATTDKIKVLKEEDEYFHSIFQPAIEWGLIYGFSVIMVEFFLFDVEDSWINQSYDSFGFFTNVVLLLGVLALMAAVKEARDRANNHVLSFRKCFKVSIVTGLFILIIFGLWNIFSMSSGFYTISDDIGVVEAALYAFIYEFFLLLIASLFIGLLMKRKGHGTNSTPKPFKLVEFLGSYYMILVGLAFFFANFISIMWIEKYYPVIFYMGVFFFVIGYLYKILGHTLRTPPARTRIPPIPPIS